jgi:outer membrane usher protein FimD/PapC
MKVNPYVAKADLLGPAVVPNTTSYYVQNVQLDRSDLPTGMQIATETYSIESPHKSRAVAEVGTDVVIMIRGQLLNSDGQPLGLSTIEITSS